MKSNGDLEETISFSFITKSLKLEKFFGLFAKPDDLLTIAREYAI